MPQTKRRNSHKKTAANPAPDLMKTLKRGPGRPKKGAPTATQIADSLEEESKRLKGLADILRGRT